MYTAAGTMYYTELKILVHVTLNSVFTSQWTQDNSHSNCCLKQLAQLQQKKYTDTVRYREHE